MRKLAFSHLRATFQFYALQALSSLLLTSEIWSGISCCPPF